MTDLHFQSATELARRIRDGDTTSRALLEHFFARRGGTAPRQVGHRAARPRRWPPA